MPLIVPLELEAFSTSTSTAMRASFTSCSRREEDAAAFCHCTLIGRRVREGCEEKDGIKNDDDEADLSSISMLEGSESSQGQWGIDAKVKRIVIAYST